MVACTKTVVVCTTSSFLYPGATGSLGAVMILLLWFYVTGFAFLIGGELNCVIEHAIKAEHRLGNRLGVGGG